MTTDIHSKLEKLAALQKSLVNGDFLLTWKQDEATLRAVLLGAQILEDMVKANISTRVFDTGLGLSIFRDKSTRTRYAFRSGCNLLGLMTEELDESTSQIAHGETVRETATMIGFLSEVIGIRDDMFLGEGHAYMKEVSASLDDSFKEKALGHRPAVVNLQCDLDHPTQSMADLAHLADYFGGVDNLRGKKIAMTWAYSPSYGKPLSVPQGIIGLMTRFGMDVTLAHPEGYDLVDEPIEAAKRFATESGGSFKQVGSMKEAFAGADIVYPKSWAPAAVMRERTRILRARENAKLADLEKQALANNAKFKDWECTEELMKGTKNGEALYMHCLPADVTDVSCKEGEVAKSVFDRYRLDTYREAGHKPFVIASMIMHTRFGKPWDVLKGLVDANKPRRPV